MGAVEKFYDSNQEPLTECMVTDLIIEAMNEGRKPCTVIFQDARDIFRLPEMSFYVDLYNQSRYGCIYTPLKDLVIQHDIDLECRMLIK